LLDSLQAQKDTKIYSLTSKKTIVTPDSHKIFLMPFKNSISRILDENRQLIFVGGKGGTGKTTVSLALGLYLSERYRTLVISTDPAHSLNDGLSFEELKRQHEQDALNNLQICELNANEEFEKFRAQHYEELMHLFDTTTYFDKNDIDQFFSLTIPGLDELMSFKAIADLTEKSDWERIVVDTAPTGHALRLLQTPEIVNDWVKVMAKLRWKYRYIKKAFKGKYQPDDADDLLLSLKKMINRVKTLITNSSSCEFIVVCKPQGMVIAETIDLLDKLKKAHLQVNQIVINDVISGKYKGEYCQKRRKQQLENIDFLKEQTQNVHYNLVNSFPEEIKGLETIRSFEKSLFS